MRTRAFFVVVALASTLAWMPSSQAGGSHRFTFYGSGWGHGVGMSQWGAYGLAREGWSAGRILTHFYPGTHVAGASQRPGKIRVGLARGLSAVHLSAQGGPVGVRVGS